MILSVCELATIAVHDESSFCLVLWLGRDRELVVAANPAQSLHLSLVPFLFIRPISLSWHPFSDSVTPTYACAVLYINNDRWKGVPFILRAGKGELSSIALKRVSFVYRTPTNRLQDILTLKTNFDLTFLFWCFSENLSLISNGFKRYLLAREAFTTSICKKMSFNLTLRLRYLPAEFQGH